MNDGNIGTVEQKEIPRFIDCIVAESVVLKSRLETLEKKLSPLLRSELEKNQEKVDKHNWSEYGTKLCIVLDSMYESNQRLSTIIYRLQI